MKMSCLTHQGLVRLKNEDAVHADATAGLAVVADGIGGLMSGEVASRVAVGEVVEASTGGVEDPEALVLAAHEAVAEAARDRNYLGKMGTTLVVWLWRDGKPQFAHIGDSRLYVLAGGRLERLSVDHTVAQRMIDEGVVSPEDAHLAPQKNVLTQALGISRPPRPQAGATPTAGRLLLCSDGLSDLVAEERIAELLALDDLDACTRELVKAALDKGGRDNVTVVVVDLDA